MSEPRTRRFGDEVDGLLLDLAANLGVTPGVVIQMAVEQYVGYRSRPDQMHVPETGPPSVIEEATRDSMNNEHAEGPAAHEAPAPARTTRTVDPRSYDPPQIDPRVSAEGMVDTGRIRIRQGPAPRCTCGKEQRSWSPASPRCQTCGLVI